MLVSTLSRKFSRNLRDYGWTTAVRKAVAFAARPVYEYRVYRLYKISTQKKQAHSVGSENTSGIRIELLHEGNTRGIAQVEHYAEWLEGRVQARLKAGDFCVVVLDGEEVVGFNLIALDEVYIPLLRMKRKLRPATAWSDHIMIDKRYRKRGLGTQLRHRVLKELRARGIKKLYGGTLRSNHASLALARRVGFQEFADVEFTRLFARQRWKLQRVKASLPSAFSRSSRRNTAIISSRTRECSRSPACPG